MKKLFLLFCICGLIGCYDSSPKKIRTYKVVLNNGKEYVVKATGYYTHHKYDSVQTVFRGGGGSFFNVNAVVEVYE